MLGQSVGESLRQARVRKGLSIPDVEKLTGIDSHILLAMELDQFDLIPEDRCQSVIASFAQTLYMDVNSVLEKWDFQRRNGLGVTYNHLANETAVELSNLQVGSIRRSRRHQKSRLHPFLAILLSLLLASLCIGLIYFGFTAWKTSQDKQLANQVTKSENEKIVVPKVEKIDTPVKEIENKITLQVFDGYLQASISDNIKPTKVVIELTGKEESWVALSQSDLGDSGILLTADNPKVETTIWDGATEALLTIGVTQAVKVTVNDAQLDFTALNLEGLTYTNLVLVETDTP